MFNEGSYPPVCSNIPKPTALLRPSSSLQLRALHLAVCTSYVRFPIGPSLSCLRPVVTLPA
eukprot:41814-Eustigmatos_ZCMA.PRE.1